MILAHHEAADRSVSDAERLLAPGRENLEAVGADAVLTRSRKSAASRGHGGAGV
jgi:hypothetical protein